VTNGIKGKNFNDQRDAPENVGVLVRNWWPNLASNSLETNMLFYRRRGKNNCMDENGSKCDQIVKKKRPEIYQSRKFVIQQSLCTCKNTNGTSECGAEKRSNRTGRPLWSETGD
jgi:hypothetical protein